MRELRKHRDGGVIGFTAWEEPSGSRWHNGVCFHPSCRPGVTGGICCCSSKAAGKEGIFTSSASPSFLSFLLLLVMVIACYHLSRRAPWEAGWSGHWAGPKHGLGSAPFLGNSGHLTQALEASASCPVQWESGLPCLPHGTLVRLCTPDGRCTPDERRQTRHEGCCLHPRVYRLLGILSI